MQANFLQTYQQLKNAIIHHNYQHIYDQLYQVPESFNWVRDVFEQVNLKDYADNLLLEFVTEEDKSITTLTYREASRASNQLLNYLRREQVQQGDRVFVMCGLHPELWLSYLAIIKGGFVMIPAANILTEEDIAYRLEKARPKAIITDQENLAKIESALAKYGKTVPVKLLLDGEQDSWKSYAVTENESIEAPAADTKSNDQLFWFFTSGTTGMPKVVAHTQASYPLGHLSTAAWIGLRPGDKHYNISQPGWAKFAWSCFFAPLNMGATVFIYKAAGRFNAVEQLRVMQDYGITTLCAPPTALRLLIQENLNEYHFKLRECVSAGEPLNPEVIEAWHAGTGIVLRDGYGQTESTCMIYNLPGSKIKYGSMGKPSFIYDIVIADEDGNEMPLHEEGQIAVRMEPGKFNGIFLAYIGDPDKEKEVFKHGLYYTGDKAYKDEEGYIWFVGRNDDVIKSSDYRIGPFEVESVLLEMDEVLESAVVGTPHAIKGQEVKAFIVLQQGVEPNEKLAQKIFGYCRENIAPFKMPRVLEFVTDLPKTISGKIRRIELRALEEERKANETAIEQEYRLS